MEGVIAFLAALRPYIPVAMMGVRAAKEFISWGVGIVNSAVEDERDITSAEWQEFYSRIDDMRRKLHSDTE